MDADVLFARIRSRLDLEPSEFVSDLENGQLCEEAYFELWDILCSSLGDESPWDRITVSTVAEQDYVDLTLTNNIYRIVRIDVSLNGSRWVPMYPGVIGSDSLEVAASGWSDAESIVYYPRRGQRATAAARAAAPGGVAPWRIYFDPAPRAVHQVRVWAVPAPPVVIAAGPEPPAGTYVSFPDDYPEYVVARVCAQLAVKQESDPAPFVIEAERIKATIERLNKPHQITAPKLMVDRRQYQEHAFDPHPYLRRGR